MRDIKGVEPLDILPDRLAIAEFSPVELKAVLGESADRELSKDNFNWIGAYLVEEVGLYESEVPDWFRNGAGGLGGRRPLDVWQKLDGFERVFDYAKAYKLATDEALADEHMPVRDDDLVHSHNIAFSAIGTILRSFQAAQVELRPSENDLASIGYAISNPEKPASPMVRWRSTADMEEYRTTYINGDRTSMYYIVRYIGEAEPTMILQSGIVESVKGKSIESESDSDLDGRPPSAGEVASFMIPLANETKNKSLELVAH